MNIPEEVKKRIQERHGITPDQIDHQLQECVDCTDPCPEFQLLQHLASGNPHYAIRPWVDQHAEELMAALGTYLDNVQATVAGAIKELNDATTREEIVDALVAPFNAGFALGAYHYRPNQA